MDKPWDTTRSLQIEVLHNSNIAGIDDGAINFAINDAELCCSAFTRPDIGPDSCSDTSYGIPCAVMVCKFFVMLFAKLGSTADDNLSGWNVIAASIDTNPLTEAKLLLSMRSNRLYTSNRRIWAKRLSLNSLSDWEQWIPWKYESQIHTGSQDMSKNEQVGTGWSESVLNHWQVPCPLQSSTQLLFANIHAPW